MRKPLWGRTTPHSVCCVLWFSNHVHKWIVTYAIYSQSLWCAMILDRELGVENRREILGGHGLLLGQAETSLKTKEPPFPQLQHHPCPGTLWLWWVRRTTLLCFWGRKKALTPPHLGICQLCPYIVKSSSCPCPTCHCELTPKTTEDLSWHILQRAHLNKYSNESIDPPQVGVCWVWTTYCTYWFYTRTQYDYKLEGEGGPSLYPRK